MRRRRLDNHDHDHDDDEDDVTTTTRLDDDVPCAVPSGDKRLSLEDWDMVTAR